MTSLVLCFLQAAIDFATSRAQEFGSSVQESPSTSGDARPARRIGHAAGPVEDESDGIVLARDGRRGHADMIVAKWYSPPSVAA